VNAKVARLNRKIKTGVTAETMYTYTGDRYEKMLKEQYSMSYDKEWGSYFPDYWLAYLMCGRPALDVGYMLTSLSSGLPRTDFSSPKHTTPTPIDDLAMPSSDLPPTEGIRIWLVGGIRVIIRPSGTEPKMKCYIEVIAVDEKGAQSQLEVLREPLRKLLSRD
jgi:phosphoglucomutase